MYRLSSDVDLAALTRSWRGLVDPLTSGVAGGAFDDLRPIADLVGSAKVVGLGESAHGSSELFRLKHRLIEFLVTELGFTAIAFEASHAGCLAIDTYVRDGAGDPAAALTGQGYTAWDCDEVLDLIQTIRRHNATIGRDRAVAFWGLDSGYNAAGRRIVGRRLDGIGPELRAHSLDAFDTLAQLEPEWPFRLNEPEYEGPLRETNQTLEELDQALKSSERADDDPEVRRLLTMMRRWTGPDRHDRSRQMGETLIDLDDQSPNECRVVVWAHNGHVGRGANPTAPTLGDLLTERFGIDYVPLALEFGSGSVHMRNLDADLASGELVAKAVDPAPIGSLPWCLEATGHLVLAANLRDRSTDPVLDRWLGEPQAEHGIGWTYTDSSQYYEQWHLAAKYDGIAFVRSSSPSHPTPHARRAIAKRERY